MEGPDHPPRSGCCRRRGCPAAGHTGAGPEQQWVEPVAPGSCAQSRTRVVMSQENGAGEGIPPRVLGKSHFARFLVSSQCFIPHAELVRGVRMQHLGRKCLRVGPFPALGCHLCPGTGPGRRQGPCAAILLPGGVCPCRLLMAEARAAHSTFPHAPVCASISAWQSPLVTAAAAQRNANFARRWPAALPAPGVGCWPCSPCSVAGAGPKAILLCTFVGWDF